MAELRVKGTGTLKLFESDNTSSVTIASPASLSANKTVTLPDADVTLVSGTMLATDGSGASLTALNASELGSGTVPTARLGSGTASSSTILYGDQTYKTEPAAGAAVSGTPVDNQIAVWTGATDIEGDSNLTYNTSTDDLTVGAGNLVIGTAGKGIDFSAQTATSAGTTTGELLDHYEEGDFTPAISSGTVTNGGSKYTRIGRIVHWQAKLTSFTSVVSSTAIFFLSGLPFVCAAGGGSYGGGDFLYYGGANFSSPLSDFSGPQSSLNNSRVYFHKLNTTAGANMKDSDVVACGDMTVGGWYPTDA